MLNNNDEHKCSAQLNLWCCQNGPNLHNILVENGVDYKRGTFSFLATAEATFDGEITEEVGCRKSGFPITQEKGPKHQCFNQKGHEE